eukprot:TRINITY_DN3185_c0_g1_i6.p1 TRINITY_DN3185_c0_g1~~TRINITY_DN3185_c0_g1_i6.p1  ORF type:complete len:494 (-),score=122.32 TRINITY_DN3185_c0_g1_i6:306-1787(-)
MRSAAHVDVQSVSHARSHTHIHTLAHAHAPMYTHPNKSFCLMHARTRPRSRVRMHPRVVVRRPSRRLGSHAGAHAVAHACTAAASARASALRYSATIPRRTYQPSTSPRSSADFQPARVGLSAEHLDGAAVPRYHRDPERDLKTALARDNAVATKAILPKLDISKLSVATNNQVLSVLAPSGDLAAIEAHFAAMPEHCIVSFSTVIKASIRFDRLDRAADYFERMVASNINVDQDLVAGMLGLLSRRPHSDDVQRLLDLIRRSFPEGEGIKRITAQLTYIDGLQNKERYFVLMESIGVAPSHVTINMLIDACSKARDPLRAERYFALLRSSGLEPNVYSYNSMIEAYCRANQFDRSFMMADRMKSDGVEPDEATFVHLVKAASRVSAMRVTELLKESVARVGPSAPLLAVAANAYARFGDLTSMHGSLHAMQSHGWSLRPSAVLSLAAALERKHPAEALALRRAVEARRSDRPDDKRPLGPTKFAAVVRIIDD